MWTPFFVPRRAESRVLPNSKYTRFIFDDWCLANKTYHFVITFVLNQTCRCLYKWRRGGQMSKSPSQAFKIQTSAAVPTQNRGSEAPLRWFWVWFPNTHYQIRKTLRQIHSTLCYKYTKYTSPNTKYTLPKKPNTHSQTPGRSQEFWVWFPELWVLQPTNLFKRSGVIRLFNKKRGLETKCITIIFTLRPWSLQTSSYTQACKSEVSPHQCRVKKQQSWNLCWTGETIKHSITTFSS